MDLMKLILVSTGSNIAVDKLFNMRRDKQPVKRLNSSAAAITRASPVKSFRPDLGSTKLGKHDNRDAKLMSRTSSLKKGLSFFLSVQATYFLYTCEMDKPD